MIWKVSTFLDFFLYDYVQKTLMLSICYSDVYVLLLRIVALFTKLFPFFFLYHPKPCACCCWVC